MRSGYVRAAALLPFVASLVHAEDIVYVTDLKIFTELAYCAQLALSLDVMSMTETKCSEGVTALQSCVCTEKGYSSSLIGQLSEDVLSKCASTASADISSVLTVFDAYCNQASTYTFPQPSVTVSQFVNDIAEMQYLAPCAYSQVSIAIMDMADNLCPSDAPHLATCVCSKNQNSLAISAKINTNVGQACKLQTADISSAQAFYAAYCDLNNGTSSFPSATNPPGDMSYYITDIPAFWSLTGCGQTALSQAVFTQTYELCPEGPQLLASCACIKPSMSSVVNSYITSAMSRSCSSNEVREAASSALSIFGMYCSAARDDTTLAGITTSIAQTAPFGLGGSGSAAATGTPTATGTKATGTTRGSSSTSGTTSANSGSSAGADSTTSDDSSKSNTPVIVGAVVGVIGGLALIALAAYFVWRHARKSQAQKSEFQQLDNLAPADGPGGPGTQAGTFAGKPELSGTPVAAVGLYPPGQSPSPALSNNYSNQAPSSPSPQQGSGYNNYAYPPPPHTQAELQGQMYSPNGAYPTQQHYSELQAQSIPPAQAELYGSSGTPGPAAELYSPFHAHHPSSLQPIYQADSTPIESPNRANGTTPVSASGLSFHSGPVPQTFSELDGKTQGHTTY
ncbi:hypothetical protein F503_01259 [Ophiostoma piceae UAMH 11346]|uniref:Uncharacterized protein n=1 Tax=Ophiostoma piceae (strain UAMH 11346) TaxID=1262450 RepID=S3C950_OPHP1|nr:hypothetical protein F503_01259 [Ophiostoma piceae UAMH 11346]